MKTCWDEIKQLLVFTGSIHRISVLLGERKKWWLLLETSSKKKFFKCFHGKGVCSFHHTDRHTFRCPGCRPFGFTLLCLILWGWEKLGAKDTVNFSTPTCVLLDNDFLALISQIILLVKWNQKKYQTCSLSCKDIRELGLFLKKIGKDLRRESVDNCLYCSFIGPRTNHQNLILLLSPHIRQPLHLQFQFQGSSTLFWFSKLTVLRHA